jgi:DNA-binding transcriptional LysR family regulator
MELHQLRAFLILGEELNFGRAAARLNMTQPPLSQLIQRLEADLGVRLFDRTRRQIALTQAGEVLLAEARGMINQFERMRETVRSADTGEVGRLVVGFNTAAAYSALPHYLAAYHERYPRVTITVRESLPTRHQIAGLLSGSIDVGFLGTCPPEHDRLQWEVVGRQTLAAALHASHPLASQDIIRLSDLSTEPFVMRSRGRATVFHDIFISACREAGFSPNIVHEVEESGTDIALVGARLGVSVVSSGVGARFAVPDVVFRPLSPVVGFDQLLAWNRDRSSAVLQRFTEIVRDDPRVSPAA